MAKKIKLTQHYTGKKVQISADELKSAEDVNLHGNSLTIVWLNDGTEFIVNETAEEINNLINNAK